MNNRDHRKITVVDGRVGFTGGYNLAEEYFNRTHPYGQWKDSGIRLEGDAVRGLTLIFLELWGATQKAAPEVERYLPDVPTPRGRMPWCCPTRTTRWTTRPPARTST